MVIMHIDFESSGGYANIKLTYYGNTNTLPEEIANKLIQLVESSKIFDLKEKEVTPSLPGPPDVLHYKLTIHEGNRRISLSFNDITVPDSLLPLITLLQELAWDQARKNM
jgi:hypothetical protein